MRIISLFAFILVSTTLLSESYHHAEAIGMDSASHGSLYGGKVVRRYGAGRFIYRGLQGRAEPVAKDVQDNKIPKADNPPKDPKDPKDSKDPDPPKTQPKGTDNPPKAQPKENNNPPKAQPKENDNPPKAQPKDNINPPKAKENPKNGDPPKDPKGQVPKDPSKVPNAKVPQKNDDKTDDDTTDNKLSKEDKEAAEQEQAQAGIPVVNTGSLSGGAIGGLAAVGGVFILVGGLFAFSQKRKNNEMTKSIVSSSAKAWEQQNSVYEVLEEESKPIGQFAVIATYTPNLADELDIQPGDTVTILVEYDDGWVQGINETRGGIKGVFPRHCVDMDRTSNKVHKNNKRSSSMGGYATEKYTEVDLS